MSRVVVTGAGGFVGQAVCRELEIRGAEVVRVTRSGANGAVACDLTSDRAIETLTGAFAKADAIVHLAAHVHHPRETPDEVRNFEAVNVDGTRRLVEAARAAGVARIVYVSTIGVYSFANGVPTEDTTPDPATAYGRTKLAGEAIVTGGVPDPRIVRLATVFGAGDTANFAKLVNAVRRRRFVIPGDGSVRKSVIAVDDAAELLADIALSPTAIPLVHLASPQPLPLRDACAAAARAFSVSMPLRIPMAVLKVPARIGTLLGRAGVKAPLDDATLAKLMRDSVVDTTRLTKRFPDHHFRTFQECVAGYGDGTA